MTIEEFNKLLGTDYKALGNVDWQYISHHHHLSDDFIREFKDKVDWDYISRYQKLSEDFIREFQDVINWGYVSAYQKLSEPFIREFQDKVDWSWVSEYQKLSEDFIREFQDKVYWACISKYQNLSGPFIREFQDKVDAKLVVDNWLYKDAAFKKEQVEKTGLYECHDDYFIGYKGIRSDRYSNYNFQYRYEKGGVYESWCDCSDNEDSFGLSVWTEEKAREYCDELVVKVKVRYDDVGRVVHDGGKVRCFKIEVLK